MWIPDLADADRMADLLAPHAATLGLPGGIGACRLVDARLSNPHLPGTARCHGWATYVLEPARRHGPGAAGEAVDAGGAGAGAGRGEGDARTWFLEAHPPGLGRRVWAGSTASGPASGPAAGPATPARFLPDLDVVAWPFPTDPALPLLSELVDPRRAVRHVPGVTPPVTAVRAVRYQPRTSAVLRVELADGGAVFAKLVDPALVDVAAVARTHRALWARSAPGGRLRVAEPLGDDPTAGLLWTRAVEGPGVAAGLDAGTAARLADDVAALTAALHATAVGRGEPVDLRGVAGEARKKVAKMAVAHPAAAERLATLLDRGPTLASHRAAAVTVHGDLHVDQLVAGPDGLVLLDLDSVTTGPPELDLAELVVDLVLREPPAGVVDRFVPRLLAAYQDHAGARAPALDRALLAALADAEFVNRCYRHLRRHLPGWAADLERELDRHTRLTGLLAS